MPCHGWGANRYESQQIYSSDLARLEVRSKQYSLIGDNLEHTSELIHIICSYEAKASEKKMEKVVIC